MALHEKSKWKEEQEEDDDDGENEEAERRQGQRAARVLGVRGSKRSE